MANEFSITSGPDGIKVDNQDAFNAAFEADPAGMMVEFAELLNSAGIEASVAEATIQNSQDTLIAQLETAVAAGDKDTMYLTFAVLSGYTILATSPDYANSGYQPALQEQLNTEAIETALSTVTIAAPEPVAAEVSTPVADAEAPANSPFKRNENELSFTTESGESVVIEYIVAPVGIERGTRVTSKGDLGADEINQFIGDNIEAYREAMRPILADRLQRADGNLFGDGDPNNAVTRGNLKEMRDGLIDNLSSYNNTNIVTNAALVDVLYEEIEKLGEETTTRRHGRSTLTKADGENIKPGDKLGFTDKYEAQDKTRANNILERFGIDGSTKPAEPIGTGTVLRRSEEEIAADAQEDAVLTSGEDSPAGFEINIETGDIIININPMFVGEITNETYTPAIKNSIVGHCQGPDGNVDPAKLEALLAQLEAKLAEDPDIYILNDININITQIAIEQITVIKVEITPPAADADAAPALLTPVEEAEAEKWFYQHNQDTPGENGIAALQEALGQDQNYKNKLSENWSTYNDGYIGSRTIDVVEDYARRFNDANPDAQIDPHTMSLQEFTDHVREHLPGLTTEPMATVTAPAATTPAETAPAEPASEDAEPVEKAPEAAPEVAVAGASETVEAVSTTAWDGVTFEDEMTLKSGESITINGVTHKAARGYEVDLQIGEQTDGVDDKGLRRSDKDWAKSIGYDSKDGTVPHGRGLESENGVLSIGRNGELFLTRVDPMFGLMRRDVSELVGTEGFDKLGLQNVPFNMEAPRVAHMTNVFETLSSKANFDPKAGYIMNMDHGVKLRIHDENGAMKVSVASENDSPELLARAEIQSPRDILDKRHWGQFDRLQDSDEHLASFRIPEVDAAAAFAEAAPAEKAPEAEATPDEPVVVAQNVPDVPSRGR